VAGFSAAHRNRPTGELHLRETGSTISPMCWSAAVSALIEKRGRPTAPQIAQALGEDWGRLRPSLDPFDRYYSSIRADLRRDWVARWEHSGVLSPEEREKALEKVSGPWPVEDLHRLCLESCLLEEMVFLPADSLDRAIPLRLELLRTYFGLSYHDMTGLFSSERLPEVNPLKKSRGGEESDRSFEEAWGTLKNFRRTGMKTKSGDYEESFRIHPTRTEAVVRELEDIFHLPPGWLWSPRGFSYRSGHSSLLDRTISVPSFDDYHDYCRAGWTLLGRVQQRREEEGEDPFPFPIAKPNNRGTLTGNAKAEFDRETKRILCAALPIAEIDDRRARFQFSPEDQAAYLRQEYGIENPSDADLAATWPEVSPDTIYLPRPGPCALVEVIESLNGAKWFPKQGEVTARKVHLDLWDLSVSEYVRSAGFSGYQEMVSILERAIHRALKH